MIFQAYLLSNAIVAEAAQNPEQPVWMSLIPMGLALIVLWLFIGVPASKRQKEHDNMVSSLQKGDKVITSGGVLGEVCSIDSNGFITLEVANNVKIRIAKSRIEGRYAEDKNNNKVEKKAEIDSATDK